MNTFNTRDYGKLGQSGTEISAHVGNLVHKISGGQKNSINKNLLKNEVDRTFAEFIFSLITGTDDMTVYMCGLYLKVYVEQQNLFTQETRDRINSDFIIDFKECQEVMEYYFQSSSFSDSLGEKYRINGLIESIQNDGETVWMRNFISIIIKMITLRKAVTDKIRPFLEAAKSTGSINPELIAWYRKIL